MEPPRAKYREVLRSVHDALLDLGWKPARLTRIERGEVTESVPSPGALAEVDKAILSFRREEPRWLEVAGGTNVAYRIEIESDILFFQGIVPLVELKSLLSRISLPVGTAIVGDLESNLHRLMGLHGERVRRISDLSSNTRLRTYGLFWLDQLNGAQWEALSRCIPRLLGRELRRIGNTHVVLTWDTPYRSQQAAGELRSLAKRALV